MRTGAEYLESIRDGRRVFIDGEEVDDVTKHPAFAGAAASIAHLYDVASDPANRDLLTFESPDTGQPVNLSYLIPRSADDLTRRRKALKRLSEATFGLMGRSPEHVAGFLSGFAGGSDLFAQAGEEFGRNIRAFHAFARDNHQYVTYTILPPQIDRTKPGHQQADPHLYAGVKREVDGGIILAGAQMLGTGTALADYVYLSCIAPLPPGDEDYALAVAIPVSAPGVKLYARRSYARAASSEFDYPLSSRFDETDSLLVLDDVFVPWEHVFIYRNREITNDQWWKTAAHLLGNNQAQIRFWTKLDFMIGIAHRVAQMNGSDKIPPVRSALGEMAAMVATVSGLVLAQEANSFIGPDGVAWPGRAECAANITTQSTMYPQLLTMIRDLCGGGLIQLPSSAADFDHPEIAADLERYVQSPGWPSRDRVQLLKLAWDLIGSEFASRHLQYEMFYAGAPFITKMRMFESFDFGRGARLVDEALSSYDLSGWSDQRRQSAVAPAAGS